MEVYNLDIKRRVLSVYKKNAEKVMRADQRKRVTNKVKIDYYKCFFVKF